MAKAIRERKTDEDMQTIAVELLTPVGSAFTKKFCSYYRQSSEQIEKSFENAVVRGLGS